MRGPRSAPAALTVAAIVPTYQRPHDPRRCLEGLEQQSRAPEEIVVVHRAAGDPHTWTVVEEWLAHSGVSRRRHVLVTTPGQIAAMEAGVLATECDIVVFVDDDVRLRPTWLELCLRHYADDRVVGVGGRDVIQGSAAPGQPHRVVGRVSWYGRLQGNHHVGYGAARPVHSVKGANMSLRRAYCVFDHRLRGAGSQIHNDSHLCLSARRRGGVLMYDPASRADHYPAARFDEDQRNAPSRQAIANVAHNDGYMLLTHLSWPRRLAFLAYTFLVGHRGSWALGRWAVARVVGERTSFRSEALPSYHGKVMGVWSWISSRRRGGA